MEVVAGPTPLEIVAIITPLERIVIITPLETNVEKLNLHLTVRVQQNMISIKTTTSEMGVSTLSLKASKAAAKIQYQSIQV